jgi:hypothetical protein
MDRQTKEFLGLVQAKKLAPGFLLKGSICSLKNKMILR